MDLMKDIFNVQMSIHRKQSLDFWMVSNPQCKPVEGCQGGLLMSKLLATCWGMLCQVFKFGYLYLGRVCLGFVLGAIVHI